MEGHNHDLAARAQLQHLLATARDNAEILRRFNEQELRLIATASLNEVVARIVLDFPAAFALEHVTLALADPRQELAHMLEDSAVTPAAAEHLLFVSPHELEPLCAGASPVLGAFTTPHAFFLPPPRRPASIALLPLRRGPECIGSLNLGSADPQRFLPDSRTDFLERLGAIAAICIENGANLERVKRLGLTDPLTGVNNRRYLDERLGEAIAGAVRNAEPLACMFLDVDHFKRFNDDHGHAAGDQVLREAAQRIRAELRRSDVLCRYGGEEFVGLLPRTGRERAREIAERIRAAIAKHPFTFDGARAASLSLSIGVAVFSPEAPHAADPATALLRTADAAVYEAKSQGRNCVVLAA